MLWFSSRLQNFVFRTKTHLKEFEMVRNKHQEGLTDGKEGNNDLEAMIIVTLHTKTCLMKHGNLGETGFENGFQRVSNFRNWVSKGFLKSFQRVSKEFQRVSKAFPKGLKLFETP